MISSASPAFSCASPRLPRNTPRQRASPTRSASCSMEPDSRRSLRRGGFARRCASSGLRFNCARTMTGMLEFFRETFQPGGNFRNFDLAIVLRAPAGGTQELQVIDHDQLDIVLCFQPARFRPQLQNAQARAVIDEHLRLRQFRGGGGQARKIALRQKAVAHLLADSRARASKEVVARAAGCSFPG